MRSLPVAHSHNNIFRVDKVDAVDVEQGFTRDGSVVGSQVHDGVRWTDDGAHVKGEAIAEPSIRPSAVQEQLASLQK